MKTALALITTLVVAAQLHARLHRARRCRLRWVLVRRCLSCFSRKNLELAEFRQLAALLTKLKAAKEGEATLLDRTQILYGSNLGNGNNHDTHNLPMLLAGGGYKHGQHLAFDKTNNYPLSNLFVTMLQRLGIEADKFASSTGTMKGLELL